MVNCFSKFSNRVLPSIFISTILQSGKFLTLAHYFPYDVKLRLLAHSRSFLANQKARNAIVGAENLLKLKSTRYGVYHLLNNILTTREYTKTNDKISEVRKEPTSSVRTLVIVNTHSAATRKFQFSQKSLQGEKCCSST